MSKKQNITIMTMPLLVDATTAARMCSLSRRYWLQLDNAGKIPLPIRFGKRKLWSVAELEEWVKAGCPSRDGRQKP
jgi:predicted DNA-binding transcriptional regulator AlpA